VDQDGYLLDILMQHRRNKKAGVLIVAVLHYHGMSLVAAALALNEEHRAELAPRLGRIPSELTNTAKNLASRQTAQFRALLRQRTAAGSKAIPRMLIDSLQRRLPTKS
jgi:hypothetical protein